MDARCVWLRGRTCYNTPYQFLIYRDGTPSNAREGTDDVYGKRL